MLAAVAAALALAFVNPIVPVDAAGRVPSAGPAATVIAKYRTLIPELMANQHIPGLAVALVSADQALWVQGFGHLDGPNSAPVTADTAFSVQSMSKLFTATAVMQAVAAGRLNLDAPITTYVPEFTVHSAFEAHPEQKITLRMLLSHTAGFTHEAPVGNNNELDPGSFDAHVQSISQTWLRFPVGTGYAYSNLGIDLAGYILERVEDKPFPDLMRDSLLAPLRMDHSTFDRAVIRSTVNRAVGHAGPYPKVPLDVPMTAAGGLYTSAADLDRFLRFQLNGGSLDGQAVLDSKQMSEMLEVPAPQAGAAAGYALGVVRHRWNRWAAAPDLFSHGGGGFGFLSDLWWAPQLGIGIAVLTNSQDHQLQVSLALSILGDLFTEPGMYQDRLLALPNRPGAPDPSGSFVLPDGMANLLADAAMRPTGDEAARWATLEGAYREPAWGVISPVGTPDRFLVENGVPYFEADEDGAVVRHRLVEVKRNVFLADNGETLDLSGPTARWRGLRLVRVGGPTTWQWAMIGALTLIAAAWLAAAAVRTVRRLRSHSTATRQGWRRWHLIAALVAAITALLVLANVGLIAVMPGVVDSGFLGWLNLPLAVRLAMHLPVALAIATVGMLGSAALGWFGRWWSTAVCLQYAVLAGAALVFVGQLAVWRLIGWA